MKNTLKPGAYLSTDSMFHKDLCKYAVKWLKLVGCRVVFSELRSAAQEQPDAIGFRSGISIVVECKVSRADFNRDNKKQWRFIPHEGMGDWRFYMCEPCVIIKSDLRLSGWGLIHITNGKFKNIVAPKGNCSWGKPPFKANLQRERKLLVSALSRK